MERIAPFTQGLTYARNLSADLRLTGQVGRIEELFAKAYEEILYRNRPAAEVLDEYVEAANSILAG